MKPPDRHYYEAYGIEVKKEKAWWEVMEWNLPRGILRKTSNCGGRCEWYEVDGVRVSGEVFEVLIKQI